MPAVGLFQVAVFFSSAEPAVEAGVQRLAPSPHRQKEGDLEKVGGGWG